MAYLSYALRFLLELAGVVALWFAGWQVSDALPVQLLAAFGGAGILVGLWAVIVAPRAVNPIAPVPRMLVGTVLLLGCAAVLALAGQPVLGAVFAVVNVLNTLVLLVVGGPQETAHADRAPHPSRRA
jgi:hypothetical protein